MKKFKKNITILLVAFIAAFFMSQNAYAFKEIDISMHNWQYSRINFNAVKNDGVEAVIIKATQGIQYQDPYLEQNYNGARNVGIKHIGFYHFMSERDESTPTQQAEDFWNAIRYKQYDIMPVLDVETNEYKRSGFEVTNRCLEFISRFKELSGQNVMIYTGGFFGLETLDARIKNQPAWIAHYGVSSPMWTGFPNVAGHQYAEHGNTLGISGDVDMDNFTDGILLSNSNYIPQLPTDNCSTSNDNIYSQLQAELNRQRFRDYNGNSLNEDGIPGKLTLSACPTVREGAKGNITRWIQLCVGEDPDGIFGENTRNAVKWFQESRGLKGDGIVGRYTWRELLRL
ncbi:GH25 family lysozyme [Clostridium sp. HBUAS56017]|uniref:GH25 family lysozyme n=1 Tax=Clostridium sp. HBUAS56017 TaxID=2571128 RepID=UPI0011780C66|nr:GH25 family lysozyme [Clostridium sp. HBUAS56017]